MAQSHAHEHECDCGCESGVYPPYIGIGTVGFILVAISMIIAGVLYIISFYHNGDISWDPGLRTLCIYVYAITGVCLLVLAAYGIFTGIYVESVLFVIFATLTFAMFFVASNGDVSDATMHLVDFALAILMLIPAIVFILNREGLLALATFAYAIGLLTSEVISFVDAPSSALIFGIGAVIGGVLFAYIATANLLYAEGGYELPLF